MTAFIGLSTGRAGSRYLTALLNHVGVKTLHEQNASPCHWNGSDVRGEISAWFVTQMELSPDPRVWHFSRHPQPFVSSLMKFGFWRMNQPSIHPYLRRTGDIIGDSFRYWVDWNRRILATPTPRRTTFRIEDISREWIARLADTIGAEADTTKIDPAWNEVQEFADIPADVAAEVGDMMEELGYARAC